MSLVWGDAVNLAMMIIIVMMMMRLACLGEGEGGRVESGRRGGESGRRSTIELRYCAVCTGGCGKQFWKYRSGVEVSKYASIS
jgi:hypothetical protein